MVLFLCQNGYYYYYFIMVIFIFIIFIIIIILFCEFCVLSLKDGFNWDVYIHIVSVTVYVSLFDYLQLEQTNMKDVF